MEVAENHTLIFAGGGSGGHIYPGIAIAERWQERYPLSQILFVGSDRTIEKEIHQSYPWPHISLPILSPRNAFRQPVRFAKGWLNSRKQIREILSAHEHSSVVGLGGFAAWPTLSVALSRQIPCILLEQNAIPGRVTRQFASRSTAICLSCEIPSRYRKSMKHAVLTGNPVRRAIRDVSQLARDPDSPVLLVTGGSQGANQINELLEHYLKHHPNTLAGRRVRHQTGSSQATDHLRALYALTEIEADVRDFFTKPQEMYQDVDTAVTRAGGTTLAELEMLDIQAVVVPMSQSADNHQLANARSYAAISGQLLIVQENQPDTFHKFTAALNRLLSIPSNHKRSSEAPQLDAVEKICDLMANTIQTDHSHR